MKTSKTSKHSFPPVCALALLIIVAVPLFTGCAAEEAQVQGTQDVFIAPNDPGPPPIDTTSVVDQANYTTEGCVLRDPETLPNCCVDGSAVCAPVQAVAPSLQHMFSTCGDGGLCVPSEAFVDDYEWSPETCTSLGGMEGVCMSSCTPFVQSLSEFLPQDTCSGGSLCAPCQDPDDGTDTGLCGTFTCFGDPPPPPPPPSDVSVPEPFSCENIPTEPVVDMSQFEPCCDGAHCVPKTAIPGDLVNDLTECSDSEKVCVPDEFVETIGFFIPPTCTMPGGIEGRCLSKCLPVVQESIDLLPQADCLDSQRCVPCCDPFTAENTGACDVGCDVGPADGFCDFGYDQCCKGAGHCIPNELIPPDMLESLDGKECSTGMVCTPDVLQDPLYIPPSCTGQILFTMDYTGVCLSKCLKIPLDFLIWSGSCSSNYDCVPCVDPLSGESTGAPGCP